MLLGQHRWIKTLFVNQYKYNYVLFYCGNEYVAFLFKGHDWRILKGLKLPYIRASLEESQREIRIEINKTTKKALKKAIKEYDKAYDDRVFHRAWKCKN